MNTKTCRDCAQTLPVANFNKLAKRSSEGAIKHFPYCKDCHYTRFKGYRDTMRKAKVKNAPESQSVIRGANPRKVQPLPDCPEWNDPVYLQFEARYEEALASISQEVTKTEASRMASLKAIET